MAKKKRKQHHIDWIEVAVQTISGVASGVIAGLIVWCITK